VERHAVVAGTPSQRNERATSVSGSIDIVSRKPQTVPPTNVEPQAPSIVVAPDVPHVDAEPQPELKAPVIAPEAATKPNDNAGVPEKGKFRETLWFKKGEVEAHVASKNAASSSPQVATGDLPVEDRYQDDGSLSRQDESKYSLKNAQAGGRGKRPTAGMSLPAMTEQELASELSNKKVWLGATVAVIAIAAIVLYFFVL